MSKKDDDGEKLFDELLKQADDAEDYVPFKTRLRRMGMLKGQRRRETAVDRNIDAWLGAATSLQRKKKK